jgi:hypothetical protein
VTSARAPYTSLTGRNLQSIYRNKKPAEPRSDGRRKVVFDRLPRTNYDRIINKLQGQGLISAGAANASRSLNELFYRYRPRNRAVPDEVIGSLGVLNKQLDRELVPIAKVLAADEDDTPQVNASAIELAPTSPMARL